MTFLAAPLISAGISYGANKLFGGSGNATAPLTNFTAPGFTGGGISATSGPTGFTVSPDANRTSTVGNIASTFGAQANDIAGLRSSVAPGFPALRAANDATINNARTASISNLRDNLARRRVLGSSFGQDAAARTDAEFTQQQTESDAKSFLQELDATNQLIQQQYTAARGQFQTGLDELNLEATIGQNLASKATDVLGKNAQTEAQLNALSAQGQGKFIGGLVQPIADAAGKGVAGSNFFKPDSGGGNFGDINQFVGPTQ